MVRQKPTPQTEGSTPSPAIALVGIKKAACGNSAATNKGWFNYMEKREESQVKQPWECMADALKQINNLFNVNKEKNEKPEADHDK